MSWIDEILAAAAEGRLERSYRAAADEELGRPANVITVHSVHPSTLDAHVALYRRVVKANGEARSPSGMNSGVPISSHLRAKYQGTSQRSTHRPSNRS